MVSEWVRDGEGMYGRRAGLMGGKLEYRGPELLSDKGAVTWGLYQEL
jgi:hypothetical protein